MTTHGNGMILLHSQDQFEQLIGRQESLDKLPPVSIVYFTANWCGACKSLDLKRLVGSYPLIAWWKCDIDANDYTAGYCGIRSIPTFLLIRDQKILGTLSNNNTDKVLAWIQEKLSS